MHGQAQPLAQARRARVVNLRVNPGYGLVLPGSLPGWMAYADRYRARLTRHTTTGRGNAPDGVLVESVLSERA